VTIGTAAFFLRCTFNNNNGVTMGGAVRVSQNRVALTDRVAFTDCIFYNNSVTTRSSELHSRDLTSRRGGAVLVEGETAFNGCSFSFNKAEVGGAVQVGFWDTVRLNASFTTCIFLGHVGSNISNASTGYNDLSRCGPADHAVNGYCERAGNAGVIFTCSDGTTGRPFTLKGADLVVSALPPSQELVHCIPKSYNCLAGTVANRVVHIQSIKSATTASQVQWRIVQSVKSASLAVCPLVEAACPLVAAVCPTVCLTISRTTALQDSVASILKTAPGRSAHSHSVAHLAALRHLNVPHLLHLHRPPPPRHRHRQLLRRHCQHLISCGITGNGCW
jgi:hypothetical protein